MKKALLAIYFLFISFSLFAGKETNNIYLFDCTNSMEKSGLWQPAKDALFKTIETQLKVPGTEFIIIPFGNNPGSPIKFNTSGFTAKKREEIERVFSQEMQKATLTHISDVLLSGFSLCDPYKENKIYLLTDGCRRC